MPSMKSSKEYGSYSTPAPMIVGFSLIPALLPTLFPPCCIPQALSLIVGIAFHIFFYDVWFYITHVVFHRSSLYWIHKVHHRRPVEQITHEHAHEAHWIENIVQPLGVLVPCIFAGQILWFELVLAFSFISLRGMMRHDHRCSWLIGNHHLLHHKYSNCNFGEYWIDYLCGTCSKNHHEYVFGKLYT